MSVDLEKMILWNNFKEAFLLAISDRKAFQVDLAFEFKDSHGHIVSMTSGAPVFINDIKLSAKPDLCFEVPYGSTNRYVPLSYAENISHEELGELDFFIQGIFHDVYIQFESKENYPKTLKAFIQSIKSHEVNDFNNSATWIKEKVQAVIDEKSFGSMDEFGMF